MALVGIGAVLAALAGCSNQNYNVKRVDPTTSTEVDYRFNDEDARQTMQSMVADCLSKPWIDNWMQEHGGQRPIVFLGNVKNNTQDYINTQLYTTEIQEELINSQRVRVKAEREARQELRDERLDTQYNDPATIKAVAKEINADFALVGSVNDNKQRSADGNKIVSYYKVDMQLINVETAEKVWIQSKELKKVATR
jgi:uncharacterized protein (TIGR02722 family)